jgi:hypothetical protein
MARKIMVIRHAEKPVPGHFKGVRHSGETDEHSLIVRGWQRAGALIRFFMQPDHAAIAVPTHLIGASFAGNTSRRPHQTLVPLSHAMGLKVDESFTKNQEAAVAKHCLCLDGVVLISWHHECIPALAAAIAPKTTVPPQWADDCFDRVWVFDAEPGSGWRFQQVPQRLLAGDAGSFD